MLRNGELNVDLPVVIESARLLKALSHPARLTICCQLRRGEMSVGDMESRLGIHQPRLSRELGKLREEGLVSTRRESKVIFYHLSDQRAIDLVDAVCDVMAEQKPVSEAAPPSNAPKSRPNPPGGYGVFARTRRG